MLAKQAQVRIDELPYKWSPHAIDFINKVENCLCSCCSEIRTLVWGQPVLKKLRSILGWRTLSGKGSLLKR